MWTVATKKPAKTNPESSAKQYDLSTQEKAIWGMISAKFALADEKERSASEIRQTAEILKEQWLKAMLSQRAINDAGVIRVLGVVGAAE
jgi:hypothetical protein